ncbi:hypothetical protein BHM03_00007468, partial [Ensete ventricosum]
DRHPRDGPRDKPTELRVEDPRGSINPCRKFRPPPTLADLRTRTRTGRADASARLMKCLISYSFLAGWDVMINCSCFNCLYATASGVAAEPIPRAPAADAEDEDRIQRQGDPARLQQMQKMKTEYRGKETSVEFEYDVGLQLPVLTTFPNVTANHVVA